MRGAPRPRLSNTAQGDAWGGEASDGPGVEGAGDGATKGGAEEGATEVAGVVLATGGAGGACAGVATGVGRAAAVVTAAEPQVLGWLTGATGAAARADPHVPAGAGGAGVLDADRVDAADHSSDEVEDGAADDASDEVDDAAGDAVEGDAVDDDRGIDAGRDAGDENVTGSDEIARGLANGMTLFGASVGRCGCAPCTPGARAQEPWAG